jgi:hypothetical protein
VGSEAPPRKFAKLCFPNAPAGQADITMGTKEIWAEFQFKTLDEGVATHIFTAFAPGLEGLEPPQNPPAT